MYNSMALPSLYGMGVMGGMDSMYGGYPYNMMSYGMSPYDNMGVGGMGTSYSGYGMYGMNNGGGTLNNGNTMRNTLRRTGGELAIISFTYFELFVLFLALERLIKAVVASEVVVPDELKKKISEGYSVVRSRLNDDVKARNAVWNDIQVAAFEGSPSEFTALISTDNVEFKSPQQLSILHIICAGHSESQTSKILTVMKLYEKDDAKRSALLSHLSNNGFSALHLAIYKNDATMVDCLLDQGVDPSMAGRHQLPPLHLAAMSGSSIIVEALLNKGASIHANDFVLFTALHCAAYFAHEQVVRILLCRGADANWCGGVRDRPLHLAASRGLAAISTMLLDAGGDPQLADDEGNIPLHFAAKAGYMAVLHILLKRSNEVQESATARNVYGDSPLHLACYAGRLDAAKALIAVAGSHIMNMENVFSETPLHAACTGGRSIELVALLLKQPGVEPNYQGQDGHTALHSACYHGHLRIVQYLLDNGADQSLSARAVDGPLHQQGISQKQSTFAAAIMALNRPDTPSSMSSHNSTISLEDQQTPVIWAYERGHDNIVALLKHYANKRSDGDVCSEYRVLDSAFRLRISLDVAQGMRYLHDSAAKPVIHRDLNSHNILIHIDGRAVVADFGESRFVSQQDEENMTMQPGNLRWMAPEVFSQSGCYDRRVDVFSFALVVWEIHSTELPFSHLKPAAAAAEMAYKRGRPSLPAQPTSQFPAHILSLLPLAWHPDPSTRPEFSQIVPVLEPHVDSHTDIDPPSTISQLKSQWEQLSSAPTTKSVFPSALSTLNGITSNGTVEELRQRLDRNGYVCQPPSLKN
uniref:Protein kinase domain-containing protein n=1 Tax=Heterorhabditis bacteriophora TaxID=37862 RepID=A0A1I7XSS6_HETBA